jgi:hypothetical protein
LSERCGNCVRAGSAPCVPAKIPPLNFLRINTKIEKLRRQEEETNLALKAQEAITKAALAEMRALRAKSQRLRKQKAMLKQKEQQIFNAGAADAEELERLD